MEATAATRPILATVTSYDMSKAVTGSRGKWKQIEPETEEGKGLTLGGNNGVVTSA